MAGPSLRQLGELADSYGLGLGAEDLRALRGLMAPYLASYAVLETLASPEPRPPRPSRRSWRPGPAENPLGAWAHRAEIPAAASGALLGMRVAIKDNVALAGVPMTNGSRMLAGYVPDADATVVRRIVAAGGSILGTATCESFCLSGGSHTSDSGPVRNPHDRTRSSGGSSSGSAALVAAGEVDLAIGCDQGGSIRIPSAWCGVVGLKPTYGLLPYTGIFAIEMTLDHVGPMARSVTDAARLLQVLAGPDGLDPRQPPVTAAVDYLAATAGGAAGLRVGLLEEGFGPAGGADPQVLEAVRRAARDLVPLGATVAAVSVPWHRHGGDIWNAIAVEGVARFMIDGDATGTGWKGRYPEHLQRAYAQARVARARDLPVMAALYLLLGRHVHATTHGRHYARAQNLGRRLSAEYDRALGTVDVLAMPTVLRTAQPLPAADSPIEELVQRASESGGNTCPFNVTGHPAISVPCGTVRGLPVGMMLVGRRGDDATVLRAAAAIEAVHPPPPLARPPAAGPSGPG
ncbi:MAG TPA: amidase [Candidatus Dormibacteraeota bacterium]|nr:amidase [Candidatus Dormibacteraeota bacterium]